MLAFHAGRIRYLDIVDVISAVVDAHAPEEATVTLEGLLDAERWAREAAERVMTSAVGA